MDSQVVARSCKLNLSGDLRWVAMFPRKYMQVAKEKHSKATRFSPRGQNPVFHRLTGCYNSDWTSLNLR